VKILWIVVGIVYFAIALSYFYLAWKARQKIRLKNLELDKLPVESFIPKGSSALEVRVEARPNGVHREVRSAGSEAIIEGINYVIDAVQKHLNRFTFPSIEKYLDETSRINTRGFIVAGMLSLIAATIAFLTAFLVL